MKIRNGIYTNYKGHLLWLRPVRDQDEMFALYYEGENPPFAGFTKSGFDNNVYLLDVYKRDLDNAVLIKTYGLYKNFIFNIYPYNPDPSIVNIQTYDKEAFMKLKLNVLEDFERNPLYKKQIKINDLEKIWEERTISEFGLPLPENLATYEEIKF